jgi:hypothetical protein
VDETLIPSIDRLKQLWLQSIFGDDEELVQAEANFDGLIQAMLNHIPEQQGEEKPASQMFMELMIEVTQSVALIPAHIKNYRVLLAEQGLDKLVKLGDDDDEPRGGGIGISTAGINLADQASLDFHHMMMGLAFSLAQATLQEKQSLTPLSIVQLDSNLP